MKQPALLIDLDKCLGCNACTVECKREYGAPTGLFRTTIVEKEHGTFPQVTVDYRKAACNHCKDAPCIPACPFGASYKNEMGAVIVDDAKCIGCGLCLGKCPYGARFINPTTKKADKCSLCTERVQAGKDTICATQCFAGAVQFGERADLLAQGQQRVSTLKARYPNANLYGEREYGGLNVLYVLLQEPKAYGLSTVGGGLPSTLPNTGDSRVEMPGPLAAFGVAAAAAGIAVKALVDRANRIREEERAS